MGQQDWTTLQGQWARRAVRSYRDLTPRSSPSGNSSLDRSASELSRFPYLEGGVAVGVR